MKKKILILDDKETIAKVLSIYLMSDYDVQWLPDGLQGVKWLQAGNTPDLIISDIRMPGMRSGSSRTSCLSTFPSSCCLAKTPLVSASACLRSVPKTTS